MTPLSTLELTPEEIRMLLWCMEDALSHHPVFFNDLESYQPVFNKLEFALDRFKPGAERAAWKP